MITLLDAIMSFSEALSVLCLLVSFAFILLWNLTGKGSELRPEVDALMQAVFGISQSKTISPGPSLGH